MVCPLQVCCWESSLAITAVGMGAIGGEERTPGNSLQHGARGKRDCCFLSKKEGGLELSTNRELEELAVVWSRLF
jgi:hypothetical protein